MDSFINTLILKFIVKYISRTSEIDVSEIYIYNKFSKYNLDDLDVVDLFKTFEQVFDVTIDQDQAQSETKILDFYSSCTTSVNSKYKTDTQYKSIIQNVVIYVVGKVLDVDREISLSSDLVGDHYADGLDAAELEMILEYLFDVNLNDEIFNEIAMISEGEINSDFTIQKLIDRCSESIRAKYFSSPKDVTTPATDVSHPSHSAYKSKDQSNDMAAYSKFKEQYALKNKMLSSRETDAVKDTSRTNEVILTNDEDDTLDEASYSFESSPVQAEVNSNAITDYKADLAHNDDSRELTEDDLDNLAKDLKSFEEELLPQLDGLAEAIPEIYRGYASMVRELVNTTLTLFKPSQKISNRISYAAEVGARAINAFGQYQAAKEHNRLLQKYIEIKRTYARANLEKVDHLIPKLVKNSSMSARLFKKYAETSYQVSKFDNASVERVSMLQVRSLSLHRTHVYLLELAKYLSAEYRVWLSGVQTSENDMPDYYLINEMLAKYLFGDDLLKAYSIAADESNALKGKQIMLLSDYQLSMMALGTKLCKVNLAEAHPIVGKLIADCGASEQYAMHTEKFAEHIDDMPGCMIYLAGLVAIIAVIYFAFYYLEGHTGLQWLLGISGIIGVYKICSRGVRESTLIHVRNGALMAEHIDKTIEAECGKVERPDIDYNERNALQSFINGFFE